MIAIQTNMNGIEFLNMLLRSTPQRRYLVSNKKEQQPQQEVVVS